MLNNVLNQNSQIERYGYTKLTGWMSYMRARYMVHDTYKKCISLFKTVEISDRCIEHTMRTYYRMLIVNTHKNPWLDKMLNLITRNSKIEYHISYWRLTSVMDHQLSSKKIHLLKRLVDIIKKLENREKFRAFYKITADDADGDARSVSRAPSIANTGFKNIRVSIAECSSPVFPRNKGKSNTHRASQAVTNRASLDVTNRASLNVTNKASLKTSNRQSMKPSTRVSGRHSRNVSGVNEETRNSMMQANK